jgi:hypothetical protein
MDSHNKESRNVRISGQCKGLPEGTRALGRVPLHCLRARLSSAPVVRIEARSLGRTGEGMVTQRPTRPARGSAAALRVGLPPLRRSIPHCLGLWAVFQRVERARARDVQGGAGGPRSGRKRSGPRSSPVAAAATTPLRFRRDELRRRHRSANYIHRAFSDSLWFGQFDERLHHPFTLPSRARSLM